MSRNPVADEQARAREERLEALARTLVFETMRSHPEDIALLGELERRDYGKLRYQDGRFYLLIPRGLATPQSLRALVETLIAEHPAIEVVWLPQRRYP